jgi:gamma-glutamyltranspeptidase/glutathione hydrolase
MGVVEPEMNGIGGDLFALVYTADDDALHGLNAGGWAPSGLSAAGLRADGFMPCLLKASTP